MTEAEWLASNDSYEMLGYVWGDGRKGFTGRKRIAERKSRLFGVACCVRIWHLLTDPVSRLAVERAERFADGCASPEELEVAFGDACDVGALLDALEEDGLDALRLAAWAAVDISHGEDFGVSVAQTVINAAKAAGMPGESDIQASLVRCIFGNPFQPVAVDPNWLTSTVVALARGIYADRAFDRLSILADALQDAGCDNDDILTHCRGEGPHARGCWVVDLVLGKA